MAENYLTRRSFVGATLVASAGSVAGSVSASTAASAVPLVSLPHPKWKGACHPLAGKTLPAWNPGEFQVHHIHTGVAESSFWIMPDGTTMLLDCGDFPAINRGKYAVPVVPNGRMHASEWIARYIARVNPTPGHVDYAMLTHYHYDHTGGHGGWGKGTISWNGESILNSGFVQAAQTMKFGVALDRCWPTFDQPIPCEKGSVNSLEHVKQTYRYLSGRDGTRIERFEVGRTDQIAMLRNPSAYQGFTVTNICGNGVIRTRDGGTRDLYDGLHGADWIDENSASTGVVAQYGPFRFLSAGDFAGTLKLPSGGTLNMESELAKEIAPVDVAKISHHGYYSTPADYAAKLAPNVWTCCVWDQLHNNEYTMSSVAEGKAYPGRRLFLPTVFPAERRISDAEKVWMPDVAAESFAGCHVVVTVAGGGRQYTVACVTADDESMTVTGAYDFKTKGC